MLFVSQKPSRKWLQMASSDLLTTCPQTPARAHTLHTSIPAYPPVLRRTYTHHQLLQLQHSSAYNLEICLWNHPANDGSLPSSGASQLNKPIPVCCPSSLPEVTGKTGGRLLGPTLRTEVSVSFNFLLFHSTTQQKRTRTNNIHKRSQIDTGANALKASQR